MDPERIPEDCPQSDSDPPTDCIRIGVLRYSCESDNQWTDLTTIHPANQPLPEVMCGYCGENPQPSLHLIWAQRLETVTFCCARWKQLCKMLVKQRRLTEGRSHLRMDTPTSPGDKPATEEEEEEKEEEELLFQGKEINDRNKFIMDLLSGLGEQSEVHKDCSVQLPVAESFGPTSKVLRFRLSSPPEHGGQAECPHGAAEEQVLLPFYDHKPLRFGICHHQDGTLLQKSYSSGATFLTVLPDGSAQVLYPSGFLAVIVVVTKENGRVCIVYDDSDASCQPMRAIFHSNGVAMCYHSNGNIRLTLNSAGGQCLDEAGARVRQWSWSSPTPLQPIFLSLNQAVGVRVLGKEQVFVSFLAGGQQAKVNVSNCYTQDGAASGPSVLKEELFVSAAKNRIDLLIQNIQQCLMRPSCSRLPKITLASHKRVAAQRLLEISADVTMSESERAFIHRCLQDAP